MSLQEALLGTLGTDTSIKFKLEGLTKGQISTAKNRFYRAGKRVRAEHPGLKLRTRVAEGYLHAWMEQ